MSLGRKNGLIRRQQQQHNNKHRKRGELYKQFFQVIFDKSTHAYVRTHCYWFIFVEYYGLIGDIVRVWSRWIMDEYIMSSLLYVDCPIGTNPIRIRATDTWCQMANITNIKIYRTYTNIYFLIGFPLVFFFSGVFMSGQRWRSCSTLSESKRIW